MENSVSKEGILERALYYESQYRNAMLSNAISFYDINLSKDIIESDILLRTGDGQIESVLDKVNMSFPCKFSVLVKTWLENRGTDETLRTYPYVNTIREHLIELYNKGVREYSFDYWVKASEPNKKKSYINQSFLLTQNENNEICALSIIKDKTESKIQEEDSHKKALEEYAYYDAVTHGYNYIRFKSRLREQNTAGSIISFDIHSFKIINAICGINKGDQVISEIWKIITEVFDFKSGELAGHINADHFIIFVPSFDEEIIIRDIKNLTLQMAILSSEISVPQLNPYYGVSKWTPEKKIELSYSEAVAAKKNARETGELNYAFFNEEDTVRLIEEKRIIDDFENALAKKQFKLMYQPKFNPLNGKLVGAEALVRWQKDDGSLVSPGSFIPIFEKNGMIRQFDEYIFRNVCQQQKKWIAQHKNIVPISVNLSRVSLYFKGIVTQYKKISEEIGVDKKLLPIEITESAAVTNNEVKDIAQAFYDAGFILHMDGFGSGYSSLATLNTMHFETLKLDKSLIDFIGNFGGDRLLEHTIQLAKELGMHVTAEGVEDASQVAFLKHLGCDSIQGYFYSKPLPRESFEILLDTAETKKGASEKDSILEHIEKFNKSIIKYPIYAFLINLTKNTFEELEGSYNWREETQSKEENYNDARKDLAEKFITEEYRDAYLKFTDIEKNISGYSGKPETRIFEYNRIYKGEETPMRIIYHLFKVPGCDDLFVYQTVAVQ